MTPDRANRSFLAFIGIALLAGAIVLCGAVGAVSLLLLPSSQWGVSWLPAFAFTAPGAVGLGLGVGSLGRQALASHRLARRVRRRALTTPEELMVTVRDAGLAGRVVLVESADSFSFVYGAFAPRVAVSRGLLDGASPGELRAVLEHEHYHVRNRDPLKLLVLRALSAALFFLPILSSLCARYVADRELAADRRAVLACGRRPLAGALLKVVSGSGWNELSVTAQLGGRELLDARVVQLETGTEPRPAALRPRRVVLSLLGAAVLTVGYLTQAAACGLSVR